jgi:uncharacterized protein
MSRRRDKASSSMAAAAMSLVQIERWLQDHTERRPVATSLPVLDGYIAAIVAGPVDRPARLDLSAARHRRRRLQPRRHAGVRGDLRRRAAPQRDQQRSFDRATSVRAIAQPQAERRRRRGSLVPGFPCRHAAETKGLGPLLELSNINRGLLLPILLHCVDDQGRPLLGPARKGRDTAEFLRNAHSDIPPAVEAMRQYWMPIRYARAG